MRNQEEMLEKIKELKERNNHLLKVIGAFHADRITEQWMEEERKEKENSK